MCSHENICGADHTHSGGQRQRADSTGSHKETGHGGGLAQAGNPGQQAESGSGLPGGGANAGQHWQAGSGGGPSKTEGRGATPDAGMGYAQPSSACGLSNSGKTPDVGMGHAQQGHMKAQGRPGSGGGQAQPHAQQGQMNGHGTQASDRVQPHDPHAARFLPDGTPKIRLVAWEVTRSCNLACKHCRAEAHTEPYPGELNHEQAKALIDTFPEVGSPIIIFTGGEPMMRPDLYELIKYAGSKGLRCVMSPNGTLITPEKAALIAESGVQRCSISIDGPDAASHDAFRGVPGAFEASMRGIQYLKEAGVEFQINTTVTRDNLHSFKDIFKLCQGLGAAAWHIFLLVPTGRGAEILDQVISAAEYEEVLNWFYDFRKTTKMHLKATCAPHYYRIMRQRAKAEGVKVDMETFGMDAMTRGCMAGMGFCFISHTGQVQPCGYLELNCGNVLQTPFPEIWRTAESFVRFRQPAQYTGKCGVCEYHKVCGGCRARAYTMTGDYMAPEPLCNYLPAKAR